MATWTKTAQLTTGTLPIGATDRLWFNGSAFGVNVAASSYQDSTHVTNSSDVHQCTTNHVHNTKYLTSSTLSLDGAASSAVSALTSGNAPLKLNFSDASSVATSGMKFYAYDGTTDATAPVGVTVQAFEVGNSAWVACNGSGSALSLADQVAATSHDFFLAVSGSPTSNGAKTYKLKVTGNYV